MSLNTRIFIYGMLIPGILALSSLAAVVLPGGDDLSLTRLLLGCGAMLAIQVTGGFAGGWLAGRQHARTH